MKTLCWIAVIGLTVVTSILWRNNAGLRKEIDAGTKTLVALSIPSDSSNQTHDRSRSTIQQSPESDETDLEISANRALDIGDGATLLRILQDWAQSNPTAALKWFHRNHSKQNLAGNGRVDAIRNSYAAILAGMIANDPAQATKLIASAPESERAVTFHFIVRKILPSDLDKLTDQLTVNPDPEFRYAGFRYIAAALGQTIRFEEARLLLEKAGDFSEDDRNQITLGFARNVDIGSFNE